MDRVAFHTVLREAAGLAGFTLSQLTSSPTTQFRTFINRRAREYWQHAWWSGLMHAELRYYRDAWVAGVYAADAEVYHSTTGKYWTAPTGASGSDVPGTSAAWSEITDLDTYIELAQTGQTEIGAVRMVSEDNPLTTRKPRPVPFRLLGTKIQVLRDPAPSSVYVWFREPAPTWLGDDFDATATYAAGRVVYYTGTGVDYEGDFWTCAAATSAGEDPEDTPAKWTRLEFPAWLREAVAQAAYADWLRQDGNPESATYEQAEARRLLMVAQHHDGPMQRQISYSAGA